MRSRFWYAWNPVAGRVTRFPMAAEWGRAREWVIVLGPAWPGDEAYFDVVDEYGDLHYAAAWELFDPGTGDRWLRVPRRRTRGWKLESPNPSRGPTRSAVAKSMVKARKRFRFLFDLEDFVRWLDARFPDQVRGGKAHFVRRQWIDWRYPPGTEAEGVLGATKERTFERWKAKVKGAGFLAEPSEYASRLLDVPKKYLVALDARAISSEVNESEARLGKVEREYERITGKKPRPKESPVGTGAEPFARRTLSRKQLSDELGLSLTTISNFVAKGLPHDVDDTKTPPRQYFDAEEVRRWIEARVETSGLRAVRSLRKRVPKGRAREACMRLREIRDALGLTNRQFGEALGVPKRTVQFWTAPSEMGSALPPVETMERAEELLEEGYKPPPKYTREQVAEAVIGRTRQEAADLLGINVTTLYNVMERVGLHKKHEPRPTVSEIVTKKELLDLLEKHEGRRGGKEVGYAPGMAEDLGVSYPTLVNLVREAGLDKHPLWVARTPPPSPPVPDEVPFWLDALLHVVAEKGRKGAAAALGFPATTIDRMRRQDPRRGVPSRGRMEKIMQVAGRQMPDWQGVLEQLRAEHGTRVAAEMLGISRPYFDAIRQGKPKKNMPSGKVLRRILEAGGIPYMVRRTAAA